VSGEARKKVEKREVEEARVSRAKPVKRSRNARVEEEKNTISEREKKKISSVRMAKLRCDL